MIRLAQQAHVAEQLGTLGCSVVIGWRRDTMGNSIGPEVVVRGGKGGAWREVPLNAEVRQALGDYLKRVGT